MGNFPMINFEEFFEEYGIIIPQSATLGELRELRTLMQNFQENKVEMDNFLAEAKRIIKDDV